MKLSIIIPCFNEKKTIVPIVKKLLRLKINLEIVIVDDGSTDGSREIIKKFLEKKVKKVIFHKKNMGKGKSIISAKKYCSGDYVVIQDADLEYDPKDFLKFIKYLKTHQVDALYGSRFLNKSFSTIQAHFLGFYRIIGNKILTLFSNMLNGQNLTDAHTCYKMFSIKLFKKINLEENGFSFCPEVNTKISNLKIKIHEIPIFYKGRGFEKGKKIKLTDFFYAIKTIIKYRLF